MAGISAKEMKDFLVKAGEDKKRFALATCDEFYHHLMRVYIRW